MSDAERERLIEQIARAIACHDADNPSECLSGEWCEENWICYRPEAVAAYHVLRARIAELEAALKPFAAIDIPEDIDDSFCYIWGIYGKAAGKLTTSDLRAARAALGEKE
jgi:hypothetical protein